MNHRLFAPAIIALALTTAGCAAPGLGGGDYERSQTRGEQSVRMGTVEQVRAVKIEGTRSGIGAATGAVVGGVGGSNVGGGSGRAVGAVIGAVIGGTVGQAIEQEGTKREGVEVTVKLDSGNLVAITQEADEKFAVGDRVRVLGGGGATRVSR